MDLTPPDSVTVLIIWAVVIAFIVYRWHRLFQGVPNMGEPRCIIAGCAFVDEGSNAQVWGDLHEVGECWVFNAVCLGGDAAWQHDDFLPNTTKALMVFGPFYEKRGVLIVAKANARLNDSAAAYIAKAPQ